MNHDRTNGDKKFADQERTRDTEILRANGMEICSVERGPRCVPLESIIDIVTDKKFAERPVEIYKRNSVHRWNGRRVCHWNR